MVRSKKPQLANNFEAISKLLNKHLNPNFPTVRSLGTEKFDQREALLVDNIRTIEKITSKNLNDLKSKILWLTEIYSKAPQLLKDARDLQKVQGEASRVLIDLASFGTKKPLEYQKEFLKKTKNWIRGETLRPLALQILSKLLELRGTEATYTEGKETLNIQNFIIKLDQKIHEIRTEALNQFFTAFRKTGDVTERMRIISLLETALRATIYSQHSGSNFNLAKDEMGLVVDFLDFEMTKGSLKNDSLENFDVLARVENLLERLIEYEERDYKNPKVPKIQETVRQRFGYKLFQILLHPRFPSRKPPEGWSPSDEIKQAAKEFNTEQKRILKNIIVYVEKSGSIYNSIKTFFRFLGETRSELFVGLVNEELKHKNDAIWNYLGHGIGSLLLETKHKQKAKNFISRLYKSSSILQRKAVADAFFELGLPKQTKTQDRQWAAKILLNLAKDSNKRWREHWRFKWSVADAVGEIFIPKTAAVCFQILEKCVKDVDGWKETNPIIYDRVANIVFGLEVHHKIKKSHREYLANLLKLFVNVGKNTTDLDVFYQVIAKYNLPALLDFIEARLDPSNKVTSWIDVVPFDWDFVFKELDDKIPEKQRENCLKQFANYALSVEPNQPAYLHFDRIWAALTKKLGRKLSYKVLKEKIRENDNAQTRIKATHLLSEIEDYDDEEYWNFLEEQIKINDPNLLSEVSATIFTGQLITEGENLKRKWLTRWSKSKNKLLAGFGKNTLEVLRKEEEWLDG